MWKILFKIYAASLSHFVTRFQGASCSGAGALCYLDPALIAFLFKEYKDVMLQFRGGAGIPMKKQMFAMDSVNLK